jgi:hypothetical protein
MDSNILDVATKAIATPSTPKEEEAHNKYIRFLKDKKVIFQGKEVLATEAFEAMRVALKVKEDAEMTQPIIYIFEYFIQEYNKALAAKTAEEKKNKT